MIEDRGREFAAAWPAGMARHIRLSPEWVATAMKELGLITPERESTVRSAFLAGQLVEEVGALAPEQAKAIIAKLHEIKHKIVEDQGSHCYSCGVSLDKGECPSCGEQNQRKGTRAHQHSG